MLDPYDTDFSSSNRVPSGAINTGILAASGYRDFNRQLKLTLAQSR